MRRALALFACIVIALASVPCGDVYAQFSVQQNVHVDGYTRDVIVDIDIEMIANHRSLGVLDVAKISDASNLFKSDYKVNLRDEVLEHFPDYKLADIVEYEAFSTHDREPVYVEPDVGVIRDYATKLEYLIDNNIITRTSNFIYNDTGVFVGMGRQSHPDLSALDDGVKKGLGDTSTSIEAKPRYYSPTLRISKTDFLTELMKINKVHTSRVIGVQGPYQRVTPELTRMVIDFEDLETSPYQSYMGQTGLDSLNNDIFINHGVFRQLNLLYTNDVVEFYLDDALKMGVITTAELGGVEGDSFKSSRPTSTFAPPGSWHESRVVRQFYIAEPTLSTKFYEVYDDEQLLKSYPKRLAEIKAKVEDPSSKALYEEAEFNDGLEYPWGDSFAYSVDQCEFGSPYNSFATEIIKRFSVVDTNQDVYDRVKETMKLATASTEKEKKSAKDKGYQYFLNEDITLADAYVLVHKFMISAGEEQAITQKAIDYINSTYALDFGSLNGEELEAVRYLIAKGILDPDHNNIKQSVSTQLTNEIAIDLLYRVHNKNQRMNFVSDLSETDRDMLDRGYSKSPVQVQAMGQGVDASPFKYSMNVSNRQVTQNSVDTLQNLQINDRLHNVQNYDYIYILYPQGVFGINTEPNSDGAFEYSNVGNIEMNASVKLIVNNEMRTVQEPYNHRLNGGKEEELKLDEATREMAPSYLHSKNINSAGGEILHNIDNLFVYRDTSGNYWGRYIVPKDSSSNLRLLVSYANGRVVEYAGFHGEGVYYLKNTHDSKYSKLSLIDARDSRIAGQDEVAGSYPGGEGRKGNNLYDQVISNDIETRTFLNTQEKPITRDTYDNYLESIKPPTDANEDTIPETEPLASVPRYESLGLGSVGMALGLSQPGVAEHVSFQRTPTAASLGVRSFGAQAPTELKMGPFSPDNILNVTFNGTELVRSGALNGSDLTNALNILGFSNQVAMQSKVKRMRLEYSGENYYIVYTPIGSNAVVESSEVLGLLGMNVSSTNVAATVPGYSRITYNGQQVSLIAKEELTRFTEHGMQIVAISDKLLWNASTGQRAFLNTDENFTMIGNNITRYPDGTVMVVSLGDKVYYNLDVVMELLNDVNAVARKSGKEIYVSTQLEGSMSDSINYQFTDIYDAKYGSYIDNTFYMTDTGGAYLSLSSLSDKTSNFIYFKDKTVPGLEMLIVYYPKITKDTVGHYVTDAYDNGVLSSMSVQRSTVDGLSDMQNKRYEGATATLSAYLFGGAGGTNANKAVDKGTATTVGQASSGVLPSGYQYNVFFLSRKNSMDFNETVWADFVRNFQDVAVQAGSGKYTGSQTLSDAIIDATIAVQGVTRNSKSISNQDDLDSTNITFSLLQTSNNTIDKTDAASGKLLFQNSANNNLFFRLVNSDNTANHIEYSTLFKNRFWTTVDVADNVVKTNSPLVGDIGLLFRQQEYYYKTHEGYVPLEIYATGMGYAGTLNLRRGTETERRVNDFLQINNGGVTDFQVGLARPQGYSLTNSGGKVDPYGGNIIVPFPSSVKASIYNKSGGTGAADNESFYDLGMFTPLKASRQALTGEMFVNYIEAAKKNNASDKTLKTATVPQAYLEHMLKLFSEKYQPNRVDNAGIKMFVPGEAMARANYSSQVLVGDIQRKGKIDENSLPYLATLAKLSENTWDLLDYKNSNLFYKISDMDKSPTQRAADDTITFKIPSKTGDLEYVATFHVGVPPEDIIDILMESYANYTSADLSNGSLAPSGDQFLAVVGKLMSDVFGIQITAGGVLDYLSGGREIRATAGYDNSEYTSMEQGFCFFAITCYDRKNPGASQLVGLAGLNANDIQLSNLAKGKVGAGGDTTSIADSMLKEMWNSAWKHPDSFMFDLKELSNSSGGKLPTKLNNSIKDWDDFSSMFDAGESTIYYQPTFPMPAGSTLVDSEGNLTTAIAPRIRNRINFCGDIVNSVLARLMFDIQADGIMFLAEVPQYSKVIFPAYEGTDKSGGGVFYKTSQAVSKPENMSWDDARLDQVPLMMDVQITDEVRYKDVNDYTMAFRILTSVYDMEVPTTGAGSNNVVNRSRLKLGSVMGTGIWRLPYTSEVKGVLEKTGNLAETGMAPVNSLDAGIRSVLEYAKNLPIVGTQVRKSYAGSDSIQFWSYPSSYDQLAPNLNGSGDLSKDELNNLRRNNVVVDVDSKSIATEAIPYEIVHTGDHNFDIRTMHANSLGLYNGYTAFLMPVAEFPPTLVVEKDEQYDYYTVRYYVNPAIYNIDVNNNYINYLKTRNTPAYSPTAALEGVRSTSMDGYTYKGYATTVVIDRFFSNILELIRWAVPAILLAMWTVVTFVFCFSQLVPATSYMIASLSSSFATDLVSKLTLGLLSGERQASLIMYFLYSFGVWTLAALLMMNYLQVSVMLAFDFLIKRTSGM